MLVKIHINDLSQMQALVSNPQFPTHKKTLAHPRSSSTMRVFSIHFSGGEQLPKEVGASLLIPTIGETMAYRMGIKAPCCKHPKKITQESVGRLMSWGIVV